MREKTNLLLKKALEFHASGNLGEAAKIYKDLLRKKENDPEVLHLLGTVLVEAGLAKQAIPILNKAITFGGPSWGTLYNYGLALSALGKLVEASRAFKNAVEANPDCQDCWFNLGRTYQLLQNYNEAIKVFKRARKLKVDDPRICLALGNIYFVKGKFDEAIIEFEGALKLDVSNNEAQNNLGIALRKNGEWSRAKTMFQTMLKTSPTNLAAHNNLGLVQVDLGNLADAKRHYLNALKYEPSYLEVSLNLADLYLREAKFKESQSTIEQAIKFRPDNSELNTKLAIIFQKQGRLKDGLVILSKLKDKTKNSEQVKLAEANILRDLGDFDQAHSIISEQIRTNGETPERLANLALVQQHRGSPDKAINLLKNALKIEPDNWVLRINLFHNLFLNGCFSEAWKEFEWRLEEPRLKLKLEKLPGTLIQNHSFQNKRLLIVCEQGIGDTFQFLRMLEPLLEVTKKISILVPPRLERFIKGSLKSVEVCSRENELSDFDFLIPIMSIPHRLQICEPFFEKPYLHAEKRLKTNWVDRFSNPSPKVGLAWSGNPQFESDYLRSTSAENFSNLINLREITFVVLQKGNNENEFMRGKNLIDITSDIDIQDGFIDTVSIIENLDLVISVDSAIAHLAGSLGKPTWLLLNYVPDWRWGLGGENTDWYPSMRIFRQEKPGDWSGLLKTVRAHLKEYFFNTV